MQITWLSYFGSENQGLPLRSLSVACWLCRHIPIVTSPAVPSPCVVTQTPMGTNSGTRRRKRKFPLLFVNCDHGRIEIDHLYGLRCRGWYCNPEQHSLCRPARPRDGRCSIPNWPAVTEWPGTDIARGSAGYNAAKPIGFYNTFRHPSKMLNYCKVFMFVGVNIFPCL